jgi:membrane-anchored protein YejM (alkaline phosphatase superfamily)
MNRKHPIDINYIFFGIFLIIELIIGTFNIVEIKNISLYSKAFFLVYTYGQYILEIFGLALIGWIIQRIFPKIFFYLFISLCFFLFIAQIIDYVVFKIIDMTFWEGLDMVLDENLENFIEMLHTTGIPFFVWIIFGILTLSLPIIAILIFKICNRLSKKRNINIYHEHFIQIFFCVFLTIFLWDFKASSSINPSSYVEYTRALPWKFTFMQAKILTINGPLTLKRPKSEKETLALIDKKNLKIKTKPNIFIFVIESLRNDYINEEITPNLYKFKNENISFERSLANANATHHSWFSLFYSHFPYFWKEFKDNNWSSGATCLHILKKMGYKINVFSAPELKYYSMRELLFGKNTYLSDSFNLYPHYSPIEACDSDKLVISQMNENLKENENVYIAFLDSTHFLYSWPKDFQTKFNPVGEIENLNIYTSKDNIDLIKNRYKNAMNFIDFLLYSFFEKLKEKNLFDDAIIVIVGDHGEEFYEEGRLFHCSHLSHMQTNVPIYFKLGKNKRKIPKRKLVCHMDVFPSIFDYLFKKDQFYDLLHGESIFKKTTFPFVITTRYNMSRTPYEFFIHTENEKLTLRFKKKKEIFKKQHIEIISYKDEHDKALDIKSKRKLFKTFEQAINRIFKK